MCAADKRPNSPGSTSFSIPYWRVLQLELLLAAHYALRSVSWEIWRASRSLNTEFDELKFGETPVRALARILQELPSIGPHSVIAELGCGRGRAAFCFHLLSGARVCAYDIVASYIRTARAIAQKLGCDEEVLFYAEDLRDVRLEGYDLVYACALCFGEKTRARLLEAFLSASPGTWLVTVGWQPQHARIEQKNQFPASFSWGRAGVNIARLADLR